MYSFDDPVPPPADDDRIFKRVLLGVALLGVLAATYEAASILWVPGKSAPALTAATLEDHAVAARLRTHVERLAGPRDMRAHPEQLEGALSYVEDSLRSFGAAPTSQVVGNTVERSRNVLARFGKAGAPVIVLGAHVDAEVSTCTPGADDNASGTAVLLEVARTLAGGQPAEFLANRQVRVAFYTNEEPPYFNGDTRRPSTSVCGETIPVGGATSIPMGSLVHARALAGEGVPVSYMLSIETVGIYTEVVGTQAYPRGVSAFFPDRGNFVAFVGGSDARARMWDLVGAFRPEARLPSEGMATDWLDGAERLSDHRHYADLGIPALMVTDTANLRGIAPGIGGPSLVAFMAHDQSVYHTPEDTPDKLNYDAMAQLVDGLTRMLAHPDAW
jgi:hypothetical protein